MNKKVLVFSASPRREGNSDLLCDAFIQGAQQAGNQVEKIFLRDKNIHLCNGCEVCFDNGGVCAQKDDMVEILDKMVATDVMVMATPVYFYTMNAQMKMLIDRVASRYTEIKNKEFYFIATAADEHQQKLERTIEGFRGFTMCLDGSIEKGIIYGCGVLNKGEIKGKPAFKQAFEMGKAV